MQELTKKIRLESFIFLRIRSKVYFREARRPSLTRTKTLRVASQPLCVKQPVCLRKEQTRSTRISAASPALRGRQSVQAAVVAGLNTPRALSPSAPLGPAVGQRTLCTRDRSGRDEGLPCPETALWLMAHELGAGKGTQIKAVGKVYRPCSHEYHVLLRL